MLVGNQSNPHLIDRIDNIIDHYDCDSETYKDNHKIFIGKLRLYIEAKKKLYI